MNNKLLKKIIELSNKNIPFSIKDRVDEPLSLYAATKSLYLQDRSKKIKNTSSSDDDNWGDLDK